MTVKELLSEINSIITKHEEKCKAENNIPSDPSVYFEGSHQFPLSISSLGSDQAILSVRDLAESHENPWPEPRTDMDGNTNDDRFILVKNQPLTIYRMRGTLEKFISQDPGNADKLVVAKDSPLTAVNFSGFQVRLVIGEPETTSTAKKKSKKSSAK